MQEDRQDRGLHRASRKRSTRCQRCIIFNSFPNSFFLVSSLRCSSSVWFELFIIAEMRRATHARARATYGVMRAVVGHLDGDRRGLVRRRAAEGALEHVGKAAGAQQAVFGELQLRHGVVCGLGPCCRSNQATPKWKLREQALRRSEVGTSEETRGPRGETAERLQTPGHKG